jgi:MtN3 and saliva related transmembrane protein
MDTESINFLGYVAATLTTIAFLPQVFKTWRSRSAKDVSLVMMITFSVGVFLWLLYGLAIQAMPVILANATTLTLALLIVILKIRYR